MSEQEHLIERDQEGNEIEIQLKTINGIYVLNLDFPIPNRPLNFIEFNILRSKINEEMIEYIHTHVPPLNRFEAAQVLANKMKQVLTKHYKSMGVL